jgi:MerR family copper efflux transcriptional regulator
VATSTLRYYERIGLVEPAGRADNGYRQYDESAVERVAFIGRAKRLGMSLDDVSNLTDAWFDGECQPLREHLRGLVSGRLRELRRGIASDLAFEQRLAQILVRLSEEGPVPERCTSDCGCDALAPAEPPEDRAPFGCSLSAGATRDRLGDAAPFGCSLSAGATRDCLGDAAPFGCSLSAGATRDRLGEWRQLLALATEIVPSPDGWRAVIRRLPGGDRRVGSLVRG